MLTNNVKVNNFALEIWYDESSRVTFYTVRQEGAGLTEMDKFIKKFEGHPVHEEHLLKLNSLLIDVIGERHGALQDFFTRDELNATALPPKPGVIFELGLDYHEFPLRLFCLRLTDEIVILFNGGLKTSQRTQDSPDLSMKLYEANSFAKRILSEWGLTIKEDTTGRYIIDDNGSVDNISL